MSYKLVVLLIVPFFLLSEELISIRTAVHGKKRRVVLDFKSQIQYSKIESGNSLTITAENSSKSKKFRKRAIGGNLIKNYSVLDNGDNLSHTI